jgi:hypothetical protein
MNNRDKVIGSPLNPDGNERSSIQFLANVAPRFCKRSHIFIRNVSTFGEGVYAILVDGPLAAFFTPQY